MPNGRRIGVAPRYGRADATTRGHGAWHRPRSESQIGPYAGPVSVQVWDRTARSPVFHHPAKVASHKDATRDAVRAAWQTTMITARPNHCLPLPPVATGIYSSLMRRTCGTVSLPRCLADDFLRRARRGSLGPCACHKVQAELRRPLSSWLQFSKRRNLKPHAVGD